MIVSIKRFLDQREDVDVDSLLRVVHLILNGLAMHAVELDEAEYLEFRNDIRLLDQQIGDRPPASQMMVTTGKVLRRVEEYGQRITKIVKMQSGELQRIVAMLAESVGALAAGNAASLNNLQALARQIERAKELEDLRAVKAKLAVCLESVQEEAFRRKSESAEILTKTKQELARTRERMAEANGNTLEGAESTGLPDRAEAEAALTKALSENRNLHVGIFVVQRLPLINSRFGYPAGDQVLSHFSAHLRESLQPEDKVFRWGGPAFVAVLERTCGSAEVRAEIANISNARLEKTVQLGARVAMLPISSRWSVFHSGGTRTLEEVCRRIAQFTA